jgi:2-oxoisovalerate ferredoxin oxidoreductase beta subunit
MSRVLHERSRSFYDTFDRKDGDPSVTHYCPGCGHGNIHKYIAEAADDLGISDRIVFVNPVGCAVFAYYYLEFGHVQAAHGRAPAVATAIKRARPESIVICYQGDGDLAAIGGNEILQAANRGEDLTVVFVNNAIYGMTGGQMAPTSMLGQVTATSPLGRSAAQEGYPLHVCELLGTLQAPAYLERVAIGDAKHDLATRKAIRKAIRNQVEGKGFSLVEVLSPCPTGWKIAPTEAASFALHTMTETFPLRTVRDTAAEPSSPGRARTGARKTVDAERIPEILSLSGDTDPSPGADPFRTVDPAFRNPRIKTAGFGGQGVLFLGSLIAEAGMRSGFAVSWLPSYGPEMRGGTAHCHVILSEDEVDSPLVTSTSVLFALNGPSLARFAGDVVDGGLIVYDSSQASAPQTPGVEALGVPAATIAEELGSARVANLVALGRYVRRTGVLSPDAIESVLASHGLAPETVARNMRALRAGMQFEG